MNAYTNFSDTELRDRLNQMDTVALEEAYLRYWAVLYDHARKMLRDDVCAKDIVQDLFTNLLSKLGELQIKVPLDAYLYKSIKNRVIDIYSKSQHKQKYINSIKVIYERGEYVTDQTILVNELKKRMELAVANFPPKMREVFEMSRMGNYSRKEIAQATKTTEGTVNIQLNRALKILRSKLTSLFF